MQIAVLLNNVRKVKNVLVERLLIEIKNIALIVKIHLTIMENPILVYVTLALRNIRMQIMDYQ